MGSLLVKYLKYFANDEKKVAQVGMGVWGWYIFVNIHLKSNAVILRKYHIFKMRINQIPNHIIPKCNTIA